ncbi:hypothetical protein [Caenimonas soli]|uniref:hypothetical protein n=1 Tax=Caenimonas soli TaxID=2735555 RepID=UPI0015532533|nr:hypothetical protein [Caenimonas soli]NPC58067.1 hypothetical protein [Caenimonas soli]
MHELLHRLAVALLLVSGALTACAPFAIGLPLDPQAAGLLAHWQFMLVLLGTGLVIAAFAPSWRLPVVTAAIITKGAFLVFSPNAAVLEAGLVLLLLVAAIVFAREAWQEARWDRMLPLRSEV